MLEWKTLNRIYWNAVEAMKDQYQMKFPNMDFDMPDIPTMRTVKES